MADFNFNADSTNATIYVRLRDSTTGLAKTGLTSASAGASVYYTRPLAAAVDGVIGPLTAVTSAHSDGGFIEVDATNAKGLYRLDLPDATIVGGEPWVAISVEFDGVIEETILVGIDPLPDITEFAVSSVASNTSSAFDTDLTDANDVHNRAMVVFRTGNLAGQIDRCTDYTNTNGRITVGEGFTETPAEGDKGIILSQ